jgi:hypothetical protein
VVDIVVKATVIPVVAVIEGVSSSAEFHVRNSGLFKTPVVSIKISWGKCLTKELNLLFVSSEKVTIIFDNLRDSHLLELEMTSMLVFFINYGNNSRYTYCL